ncbi:neuroligin-1-like [Mercenaria mercenaria]|uniref:neuroligin-1-like n=1 Tax=Mercenaria mercenaria TaxID=6596 RepID=UPI00234F2C95|nr:neuroligin-1-like [Mercenaria mercenaria]
MDYILNLSVICLLSIFVDVVKIGKAEETRLDTKRGTVIGEAEFVEFNGEYKPIVRFLGIPYAKPPVGERRFTKPEPYGNFTSLYNATFHRPHCMQTRLSFKYIKDYQQDEDCLYLNIYIPGNYSYSAQSHAVMIYIHGGGFLDGGADIYVGDKLSAFNDIIVVAINYRLNVFGFLSDGANLRGNFGLWDMKLAIQWVHDNINDYGGDPTRVTLFGQSAGGAAVMYQAINPNNRGLIHRVIAQSGSIFGYWALQRKTAKTFDWFASSVNCSSRYISETMKCLRSKPATDLKLHENEYVLQFVPNVDSEFLPEEPEALSKRNSEAGRAAMKFFSEIDFLNGVTSSDGNFAREYWTAWMKYENIDTDENISEGVPKSFLTDIYIPDKLSQMFDNIPDTLKRSVVFQYTDWSNDTDPFLVRSELLQFESDTVFFVPSSISSRVHQRSKGNQTSGSSYFYVFDHKPSFVPDPDWLEGATHVMDLAYIFGFPKPLQSKLIKDYHAVDPFKVLPEDFVFSKVMMTLWSNFAKTGNPNLPVPNDDNNIPVWPTFDLKDEAYLSISTNMSSESVQHHFDGEKVAFWEGIVPLLTDCNDQDTTSAAFSVQNVQWLLYVFMLCAFVFMS